MTLFNRPIGIWAIAVYSLYGMIGTALSLLAVASPSTVVANIYWDFYLLEITLILLNAALLVGALSMRKAAINLTIAILITSFLGYILPAIRLYSAGVPIIELFGSLFIIGFFALGAYFVIFWYLSTLRKRGMLR